MVTRPLRFTVVGGSRCDEATASLAERIGSNIARRGGVLICGGLSGVMEAASRGAADAGGLTVGILPGTDPESANAFIQLPIVTGMGDARNVVNVLSADAVIAVKGSYGTMNEIAEALGARIPVVAIGYWDDIDGVEQASDAEAAVEKAFEHARSRRR